jgi:hypothetical protein
MGRARKQQAEGQSPLFPKTGNRHATRAWAWYLHVCAWSEVTPRLAEAPAREGILGSNAARGALLWL